MPQNTDGVREPSEQEDTEAKIQPGRRAQEEDNKETKAATLEECDAARDSDAMTTLAKCCTSDKETEIDGKQTKTPPEKVTNKDDAEDRTWRSLFSSFDGIPYVDLKGLRAIYLQVVVTNTRLFFYRRESFLE